MEENKDLIPFEGKPIRKVWHNDEWHFAIVDVIEVLTGSLQPSRYWSDLKKRSEKAENQSFDFCERLNLPRPNGRNYPTDCANAKGVLRIIMSVTSPKAEPLKLWLAEVGAERMEEAENPELLTVRQAELYRAKGYPDEWIMNRVESIKARKRLTEEWKNRGVRDNREYSVLTAVIAQGTFGLTPSEHGKLKGLEKQNLRDHMTPIELIFSALGEEATRLLTIKDDAQGYTENHEVAVRGGRIAGEHVKGFEERMGLAVVSSDNFLGLKDGDKPGELPPSNDKS